MGLNIGNVNLPLGLFLGPMAGYTDRAMRVVSHMCGAEYSTTEMVCAKAVVFGDKKTHNLARIKSDEGNVSLQIFGSEPEIMAEAAAMLSRGYDGEGYVPPVAIDINMGCPVNKIFGNGEGSALMKDPDLIHRIVEKTVGAVSLPVTVKIRAGVDPSSINAVECALAAESAGASLLCIHGRTRSQLYGGKADKEIIRNVKNSLHIPVIANGDVVDYASYIEMKSYTGADGVMIGRAAIGNPFIFREIVAAERGETYSEPSLDELIDMAMLELKLAVLDKGERVAIPEARKKIALYFKGFRGSASLRAGINSAVTFDDVCRMLDNLRSNI